MGKILLKQAGNRSSKKYQEDIAKITKETINLKSDLTSSIEMYSVRDLKNLERIGLCISSLSKNEETD